MTAFPKYERYKDSGVDWLGDVPEHWEVAPFQGLFDMSLEKNGNEIVGKMLSISGYRGIELKRYESDSQKRTKEQLADYRVVRTGQLAVNTMWLNYAGLGVSELEGHMSPAYRAYSIRPKLSGRYAHHLLRSSIYVETYTGLMQGIRPNSMQIKNEDFKKISVLIPPKPEQDRIVAFLDQKTAEIDALIAKKQRQIELLDEQKAILINRAVTRGLNPNAKLKPSGIEWIGEIPERWEAIPLRRFIDGIQQGVSPATVEGEVNGASWGVLKSGCCNGGVFREDEHKRLPERFKFDPTIAVRTGDLLVSRACGSRDLVGSTALVGLLTRNLILSDKNFRLLVRPSVDPAFLNFSMNSFHYRRQIEPKISGADGLPNNIPGARLKEIVFPIPSFLEQKSIVQQLDSLASSLREAIILAGRQIDSLKTLRSTLIAHAVTGRIKV